MATHGTDICLFTRARSGWLNLSEFQAADRRIECQQCAIVFHVLCEYVCLKGQTPNIDGVRIDSYVDANDFTHLSLRCEDGNSSIGVSVETFLPGDWDASRGQLPQTSTFGSRLNGFPASDVLKFIENCSASHASCRRLNLAPLPRRVIDVGHAEAFLHESKGGDVGPYVTLSHCWSNSMPLVTTRDTYNHRLGRLFWSQLPLAFQEAIEITRKLRIRYLWIDSLCIMQDDESDWEIESARMASIYENSFVTLAMHQPGPNLSSLPDMLCAVTSRVHSLNEPRAVSCTFRRVWPEEAAIGIDTSCLSERAWCFQERLLSNRVVHCLPDGLVLECAEAGHSKGTSHDLSYCDGLSATYHPETLSSKRWRDMITMYTAKQLTFEKDLLPALSGIVNRVRSLGRYYGGTWESTLASDLVWYSEAQQHKSGNPAHPKRAKTYIAPSFLWSSVVGRVRFVDLETQEATFTQNFTIEHIACEPKGANPIGELAGGCLTLSGRGFLAEFVHAFDYDMPTTLFTNSASNEYCLYATLRTVPSWNKEKARYYIFHPDTTRELWRTTKQDKLLCLELFSQRDHQHFPQSFGIVVKSENGRLDDRAVWQRIGFIGSIPSRRWESAKPVKVTIV